MEVQGPDYREIVSLGTTHFIGRTHSSTCSLFAFLNCANVKPNFETMELRLNRTGALASGYMVIDNHIKPTSFSILNATILGRPIFIVRAAWGNKGNNKLTLVMDRKGTSFAIGGAYEAVTTDVR